MGVEGVEFRQHPAGEARQVTVDTAIGGVCVLDYGGSGVDALMFHSPGFCADSLSLVAAAAADRYRCYSVELPGHGHAPTGGLRTTDFWPVIPDIVAGLGLVRPMLVGFDLSGFMVVAAAVKHPDLAAAVVSVGGWCLRTREETAEFLAFVTADDVMAGIAERMLLGARASDEEGMRAIMRTLARNSITDFLIDDEESRFAEKIESTVRVLDDGTFLRRPTVATMLSMYDLSIDDAVYPERGLLEAVSIPCTLVLSANGLDQEFICRANELADQRADIEVVVLRSGNNPQMSHPGAVADALAKAAARIR